MFPGTSSHACSPTTSTPKKPSWNFPFVGAERQKSPPSKRPGFVRLDSVGSEMTVGNSKSSETRAEERIDATKHSPSERRWFGAYQYDSFNLGKRNFHNQIQVPYNLSKQQFEPMSVLQHSNSCPVFEHPSPTLPSTLQHSATSIDVFEMNQHNHHLGSIFNTLCKICQATMATVEMFTSTLNPNARSFTPLNPNAKEFTPTAPPPEEPPAVVSCEVDTGAISEKPKCVDSAICSAATSHNSTFSEEEQLEVGITSSDDSSPPKLPEIIKEKEIEVSFNSSVGSTPPQTSGNNVRGRTWSSCSEDSLVEFLPSDQNNSTLSCDTNVDDDESEDDDDFSDEEDDSDWDEVDASDIRDDDIPEELLNCGLFCPSTIPSKPSEKQTPTSDLKKNKLSETIEDHDERYPVNQYEDQVSTVARLARINADWNSMYSDVPAEDRLSDGVRFDNSTDRHYEEDPEMSDDLHEARKSDLPQRRADKMRMERLMAPIFDPKHRERIYAKLHGN